MKQRVRVYKEDQLEGIELRSEKMREVMGDIPRALIWISVGVLVILICGLVAAVVFFPSPYAPHESILRHVINGFDF